MIELTRKLCTVGMEGNPGRLRRQIGLSNQVGLFGFAATVPYQLFYYFYDLAFYRGIFLTNLLFMAGYLSILLCNYRRRYNTASSVLLINGGAHLFVSTYFIGTGAGANLFYFVLVSIMAFLYQHLGKWAYSAIMAMLGTLFTLSHFLFPPGSTSAPVPSPWVDIMYVCGVVAVLVLAGVPLYLFRQESDRAEEELTLSNRQLETLSHTDPLTGLANRRVLEKVLEQEWSRLSRASGCLSIIVCDVDHFKGFNDHYGHDQGDRCLQQIAKALEGTLSRPSDLVVRYGGEEFVLVLPDTDAKGARWVGEKLCQAVERLHITNAAVNENACVTLSAGVASIDSSTADMIHHSAAQLLERADRALYQAKASGRNRVVYLA